MRDGVDETRTRVLRRGARAREPHEGRGHRERHRARSSGSRASREAAAETKDPRGVARAGMRALALQDAKPPTSRRHARLITRRHSVLLVSDTKRVPTLRAVLSQYPLAPWDSRAGRRGARDDERFGSILAARAGGTMAFDREWPLVDTTLEFVELIREGSPMEVFAVDPAELPSVNGAEVRTTARSSRVLPPERRPVPKAGLPDPARRPRGSFVSAAASRDASSSADEPAADAHRLTPVWCRDADGRTVVVPRPTRRAPRPRTSLIPLTDDWFVLGLRFEVDAEVRQIFNHQGFHALAQRHIRCFVVPAGTTTPRAYSSRRRPRTSTRRRTSTHLRRRGTTRPGPPPRARRRTRRALLPRRLSTPPSRPERRNLPPRPPVRRRPARDAPPVSSRIRRGRFVGCQR